MNTCMEQMRILSLQSACKFKDSSGLLSKDTQSLGGMQCVRFRVKGITERTLNKCNIVFI